MVWLLLYHTYETLNSPEFLTRGTDVVPQHRLLTHSFVCLDIFCMWFRVELKFQITYESLCWFLPLLNFQGNILFLVVCRDFPPKYSYIDMCFYLEMLWICNLFPCSIVSTPAYFVFPWMGHDTSFSNLHRAWNNKHLENQNLCNLCA